MPRSRDDATWFATAGEVRAWFEANHATETELWIGLAKKHIETDLTYKDALLEALCFGWIDGLRQSVDRDGFAQRFSPRTSRSPWSAPNIARVEALIVSGRMHEAGLTAYRSRDPQRAAWVYGERDAAFDDAMQAEFETNVEAWEWFCSRPPGYRRQATWWVMSAKRPETRQRRLRTLIEESAQELPIAPLRRTKP